MAKSFSPACAATVALFTKTPAVAIASLEAAAALRSIIVNALAVSPSATFAKANSKKAKSSRLLGSIASIATRTCCQCAPCRRGVSGELLEQCEGSFEGYFIVFCQGEITSCHCRLQRSDA